MDQPAPTSVNVFNPDDELVSLPVDQLGDALQSGYRHAMPDEVKSYNRQKEFGTTGQKLITAAEGLAAGATLHMSDAFEKELELSTPERMQARQEENPWTHAAGEVGGLAATSFLTPEFGAGKLLGVAGDAAVSGVGLKGATSIIGKIGSAAVRGAVENGIYQGTDEAAKLFMGAPDSVETAAANVGLAGLLGGGIGGGLGAVSPIWKATMGDKLGTWLGAISRRMDGNPAPLPDGVRQALETVGGGPEYPAAAKGAIQHPELANDFHGLMESKTAPGQQLQTQVEDFRKGASGYIAEALGKTPDELLAKGEISHYEAGAKVQDSLGEQIKKTFEPISDQYDKITQKFSDIPITNEADIIADKLAQISEKEGWGLIKDSPQNKMYNSVMDGLSNVKTLEDLRKFQSNIWNVAKGDPAALFHPARVITTQLDDVLQNTYLNHAGMKGADFLDKFQLAKEAYKSGKNLIEDLNDRLHVGKYGGPGTFVNALKDMKPEAIISRLSNMNDVGLQQLLTKEFPKIAEMVKDYQLNKLVGPAVTKAGEGHALNSKVFFTALDNMTPEMRKFVLPAGAEAKLGAMRTLLDSVPKYKSSGTAGNLDKLWANMPGSASAAVSMLLGHNPIAGWMVGTAAKWAARDAPDAAKLAMLKFMGSDQPIDAEGFKAVLDFAHRMIKGENVVKNAVKGVFDSAKTILPSKLIPDAEDNKKLDEKIKSLQMDPNPLMNSGGKIVHYAPEHAQHIAQVSQNAVNYLNSLRPDQTKHQMLDSEPKINSFAHAQFQRALTVAQSPMVTLQSLKDGTLTPQDVNTFKNLYPTLYARTTSKLYQEMAGHIQKGNPVDYHTRLGLSLFFGQPLDSTMTPQGIISAQPLPPPMPQQQGGKPKGNMEKLGQIGKVSMTQDQASLSRSVTQRN